MVGAERARTRGDARPGRLRRPRRRPPGRPGPRPAADRVAARGGLRRLRQAPRGRQRRPLRARSPARTPGWSGRRSTAATQITKWRDPADGSFHGLTVRPLLPGRRRPLRGPRLAGRAWPGYPCGARGSRRRRRSRSSAATRSAGARCRFTPRAPPPIATTGCSRIAASARTGHGRVEPNGVIV